MLKDDLGNNQSCPSWHGLKLHWVLPGFLYQSSLWWYTCRNQHVSNSKLRRIQLLTYSRQKAKPVKNTWYNHFLQWFINKLMVVSNFSILHQKRQCKCCTLKKNKCNERSTFRIECKISINVLKKIMLKFLLS